jgi:hypothetical protein
LIPSTIRRGASAAVVAIALAGAVRATAQTLTTPEQQFGHQIGADYVLPNYQQLVEYWRKLDGQSDRMRVLSIGRTAEGREQVMAIVSSPQNLRDAERYRDISRTLAMGRVDSATAARLAADGKAIVWIDGGLHASEVLGAQQLMETVWQLISRDDAETRRILDDVIILAVHANPDGMELVSNWYTRNPNPQQRTMAGIPRLYQKYIGHDNNRDFYASTQPETENMNRVMYHEWLPQIVYNHHQTGPTGTVMFAPPFRDPFNFNYDPLIVSGIDMVGAAMQNRFLSEDKPGVTQRKGSNYSTWWNGGLRTTAYFHNMIGLLTETIGNPTPMDVAFVPARQIPSGDLPSPVAPQQWHFRRSIDYSITANYAVLDYASRYRQTLLTNMWRMARNSVQRGQRDEWTVMPRHVDSVRAAIAAERGAAPGEANAVMVSGGQFSGAANPVESARYQALLHRPEWRDARGYVIPSDQADFATAGKFIDALRENGVEVQRATAPFTVAGKRYPAGSYVVMAAQPFRPHVMDMFEPQDHPNDFLYQGGPPIPPYDNAGWTLAYQMGVKFDRVLEGFTGPFQPVTEWNVPRPAGRVAAGGGGWILTARQNDAFSAVNRLLASGQEVWRVRQAGRGAQAGDFWVSGSVPRARVQALADSLGLTVGTGARPSGATRLRPLRIALWDRYGGSMPSGWTRWIFEQFGFPYQQVFQQELDAGNLNAKYDVIVFVDGAIPERDPRGGTNAFMPDPATLPEEFRTQVGNVTVERTVPKIREFLENGGTVLTIGSSTALARHLGLPVEDAMVEAGQNGEQRHLPREKFFIPGSLLQVRVDNTAPVAWGMETQADVMFDDSPVFRLGADAASRGVRRVAWYDSATPLRSGWAWGQQYLQNGAAVVSADVGRGTLYLFGPEIAFRAQPHGTFKLLFNGLYESVSKPAAQ